MTTIYHYHTNGTEPPIEKQPWILVFGSNQAGRHGAGAAKLAFNKYGARYGIGFGQEQRSYAIPTKNQQIETLSLKLITDFVKIARKQMEHRVLNAHDRYWFTAIGCGLAGYSHKDIAPMFADIGKELHTLDPGIDLRHHFSFPKEWMQYLEPQGKEPLTMTRFFYHPESESLFTTNGEDPGTDGLLEEISAEQYKTKQQSLQT